MRHDVSLCGGFYFPGDVISTNSLQSLDPYDNGPNWTNKPRVSCCLCWICKMNVCTLER